MTVVSPLAGAPPAAPLSSRRGLAAGQLDEHRLQAGGGAVEAQQVQARPAPGCGPAGPGRRCRRGPAGPPRRPSSRSTSTRVTPSTPRAVSWARAALPCTVTSISLPLPPRLAASSCSVPWATISPGLDHQQAIAGLADLRQEVAGDQQGVLAAQLPDQVAHLDDLHRVQAAGRLVQDQQRRLVHQRLGHAHALPVAVRQAADQLAVDVASGRSSPRPPRTRAAVSRAGTPRNRAAKAR